MDRQEQSSSFFQQCTSPKLWNLKLMRSARLAQIKAEGEALKNQEKLSEAESDDNELESFKVDESLFQGLSKLSENWSSGEEQNPETEESCTGSESEEGIW